VNEIPPYNDEHGLDHYPPQQDGAAAAAGTATTLNDSNNTSPEYRAAVEAQQLLRQEQARLERLVQATGQRMVPIRSNRGNGPSLYYTDQGFAAALAQHLEQTAAFSHIALPQTLPPAPSTAARDEGPDWNAAADPTTVFGRLAAAPHPMILGSTSKSSRGDDFERWAEMYLDKVIPQREVLFQHTNPVVESLL
jgi:hypothetical protein